MLFTLVNAYGQCDDPDTTSPLNIPPPNIVTTTDIGSCFAYISAAALSYPTVFDACGVVSTVPTGIPSGYEFPVGTTTITWTVSDAAGNSTTSQQTVTVTDEEDPTLICPANMTVNTSLGQCNAVVTVPLLDATDNCAITTISNDYNGGGADASDTYPLGTTTVTYTVTDSANRTTTCSVDITVENNQIPEITLIGGNPITIEACDTYNELGATATDNCFGNISSDITIDSSELNLSMVGSYSIYYNVTNEAGIASNTVVRTINVIDTTAPTFSLNGPSTLTIGNCSTYTELGATALDGCLGDISSNVVIDNSSVDTSTLGSYTVTYNVTDNNGNTADTITRTVIVIDNSPPEITLIGEDPLIIESCSTYGEPGATAFDPCPDMDYNSQIVIDASNVDTSIVGSYFVTYNVMDTEGNEGIEVIRTVEVVDTTPPVITLIGDNPQVISSCATYVEQGATALDPCSNTDYSSELIIDTSSIDLSTEDIYPVSYTVCDSYGNCSEPIIREVQVVLYNDTANAGPDQANSICTDTTIDLAATPVLGSLATGQWTVTSSQTSGFSFSDSNSPTSTFTGDVGQTYILTWTIDNLEPCPDVSDSMTVTFLGCNNLDFDGVDDNITFNNNFNLETDFTIEIWIKSELQDSNIQTILSKRESSNLVDGYDLRLVNNIVSFNWNDGESLSSPFPINTNQWHHIAVTNAGNNYTLYIDGIELNSTSGSPILTNSLDCLVGAMDRTINAPFKPTSYFNGSLDELRIWDVPLTQTQIQKMMNQEIEDNAGNVYGSTVPLEISGLSWSDLNGYYQMNQSDDISVGSLLPNSNTSVNGTLRYMTTLQPETAPLPYQSANNGVWTDSDTWLYGSVQAIPNSTGIDGTTPIDWNIVKTNHTISSGNNNLTLSALLLESNTLSIENSNALDGQSLRLKDYLLIDGTLDLVGESQLLQDINSIVDLSGTGTLERDQQGTTNLYNYNYWCSPVNNGTSNYTVNTILWDGTDPDAPMALNWTSSNNATGSTSPITLSNKWIYTYENAPENSYSSWVYKGATTPINLGFGFTLKGSGVGDPIIDTQNYVFIGQPNNGTITTTVSPTYQVLTGNPYPSALDADQFILDNGPAGTNTITGALYFWEHAPNNNSHILSQYEGGYAIYSLSGGVAAVSPPEISGAGNAEKIPQQFIPVAQGFYVLANDMGGTVEFNNGQRVFEKEADNSSVFFRTNNTNENQQTQSGNNIQRVRLDFTGPNSAVRHLLLAFTPNNAATEGIDYSYDAINTEDFSDDMLWNIEEDLFVIQGVGAFDNSKIYPVTIEVENGGDIQIELTALENFNTPIDVFVYDALLGTYTSIKDLAYQYNLEAGSYTNRFYITFSQNNSLDIKQNTLQTVTVNYLLDTNEIWIQTPLGVQTKQVTLINMLAQTVKHWDQTTILNSSNIHLPLSHIAEGHYIVKLTTNLGVISKKLVVKY